MCGENEKKKLINRLLIPDVCSEIQKLIFFSINPTAKMLWIPDTFQN